MAYQLTKKAGDDIRQIYRAGAQLFGRAQAAKYHAYLETIFEMLAENPRLARLRDEITPPVRIHPSGSHLIVYVERESGGILIVRIRHFRENWQS